MKKLLLLLLCVPLLVLSQEYVTHDLIGWTNDNKVIYKEENCWHIYCTSTIKVQNLITDKIDDYTDTLTYQEAWSIDSVDYFSYIERFLKKYKISKQSILLYENIYIKDYNLKIILSLNEQYKHKTVFDVLVGNKVIGYKRIGSGSKADDITIRGYYISPFDSRVLIVIETNTMHSGEEYFEGMENEMKLYYFGCSLNPSTFK
jgi:hypothetical protein